jgi:lysophospholipase L1-like esterase
MPGRDVRICFVGDSFVQGTCDPDCLGWVGRVSRVAVRSGVRLTAYNLGVRRQTSGDILGRWLSECGPRLPAGCDGRVVFSFGTNDTTLEGGSARVAQAESIRNAEAILRAAKARWPTVMVGPPPMLDPDQNERTRQLSEAFGAVAGTAGVPYLSVFERLLADPRWAADLAAGDGSHPGGAGYDLLARLVLGWPEWWYFEGNCPGRSVNQFGSES